MNRANRSPAHPKWKSPCARNKDGQVPAKAEQKWSPHRHSYCFYTPLDPPHHMSNLIPTRHNHKGTTQEIWNNMKLHQNNIMTTKLKLADEQPNNNTKPNDTTIQYETPDLDDFRMKWQILMKQHDTKWNEAKWPLQITSPMAKCNLVSPLQWFPNPIQWLFPSSIHPMDAEPLGSLGWDALFPSWEWLL